MEPIEAKVKGLAPTFYSNQLGSLLSTADQHHPQPAIEDEGQARDRECAHLVQVNSLVTILEDEMVTVFNLLRDRYAQRFPEMESFNLSAVDYARTVLQIGDAVDIGSVSLSSVLPPHMVLVASMTATTSEGRPLGVEQLHEATFIAQQIISMHEAKLKLLGFLEGRLAHLAPNVAAIVGTKIASQLVGAAGGVLALSKIPAGNIQVLGRSRKELAGFSLSQANPHAGFIFECDLVANTPPRYKVNAQRLIANKIALAARMDTVRQSVTGEYGRSLRKEIIDKLERLNEPAPVRQAKPIPPPPIESSKKRGGKRARRLKELYAQTTLRRMKNRAEFGKPEEEIVVGSSVVGLGELGAGASSGRVRLPAADNKLREAIKKQSQKAFAGRLAPPNRPNFASPFPPSSATTAPIKSSAPIAGTATSLSFTPLQGIELNTAIPPSTREGDLSKTGSKYFGANLSFRK